MHRTAPAATASGGLAVHLTHHRLDWYAAGQRVAVLAVGGDDVVIGRERLVHPDCHCFLADIDVHETADFPGAVHLDAFFLEAPDEHHLGQQVPAVRG